VKLWLLLCVAVPLASAAEQQTRFVVTRPTLISFFLDSTDKKVRRDGNEALAGFQFYLPDAEHTLEQAGVEVHQVFHVTSFRVKSRSQWRTFAPRKVTFGYYFVAPGREPRIEYGADDTDTILGFAAEYFHLQLLRDDFLISSRGPGNLTVDMSKDDVRRLYPESELSADGSEIRILAPQSGEVAIRIFLNSKTSRIVEMDVFDSRYRTDRYTNLGPGATFGELLHNETGLSLVQVADTWAVASASICLTFQLDVDDATRRRLDTEERIDWQRVIPESTPIRAVTLFASGCRF
jgi:hypothetical protein